MVHDNLLTEDFVIENETLIISNGDNFPLNQITTAVCADNTLSVVVGSSLTFEYRFRDYRASRASTQVADR